MASKVGSALALSLPQARAEFFRRYPAFAQTERLDALRATEYERLDRLGHVYLDYTGGGLYAWSQVQRHLGLLRDSVFGNPHSASPASAAATRLVEEARTAVRRFFNAGDDYEVVFTGNATGALRLVGEAYPFRPGGAYLLTYDNHNSVNGIREFAHRKGAAVVYVPVRERDLRLDEATLDGYLRAVPADAGDRLFAYPAQSNFSGVQHPLAWVERAQALGWDVLLDCAAFVPTNRLDLQQVQPDFVPISFYKLFGYPTGVGALIARRDTLAKLERPWFAGGTIAAASVEAEGGYRLAPGAVGFEDGTLDYLGLPAVTIGIEYLEEIGVDVIHERVRLLTAWLLEEMAKLRHANGAPLVRVFGPRDVEGRGGVIAHHLLDAGGRPYDVEGIAAEAARRGISLRTGCFCNPGDGEIAHQISADEMRLCFDRERPVDTTLECQRIIEDETGKVPNTIRASLGLATNFDDVYRYASFIAEYRDR